MKLKTRIIVGFGMSILVPLLLFSATLYGLSHTKFAQQAKNSSEVVYDISVGESANSQTQVKLIAKDVLFTATGNSGFYIFVDRVVDIQKHCNTTGKIKERLRISKREIWNFVLEVEGDDEFSEL